MVVNKVCVVINRELITPICPLPKGVCIWKHRVTGYCKYDSAIASDISEKDLCDLVGLQLPSEDQLKQLKAKLVATLKAELTEKV
jgi:hypothetical protein